jgi:hypothetical protein
MLPSRLWHGKCPALKKTQASLLLEYASNEEAFHDAVAPFLNGFDPAPPVDPSSCDRSEESAPSGGSK